MMPLAPLIRRFFVWLIMLVGMQNVTAQETIKPTASKSIEDKKAAPSKEETKWKPLLEVGSFKGWEFTNFGGEAAVEWNEGVIRFDRGEPMTGINMTTKDFPKENYEMRWKATRIDGSDFFAGVTFPVGSEFCSLICGGWGGGLVGLSSINGNDASENETTGFHKFKNKQWYSFRVRVDKQHLTAWIDDEEIFKVEREEKKFSTRAEVFKCKPVGYCVFQSIVDVKDWEYQTFE